MPSIPCALLSEVYTSKIDKENTVNTQNTQNTQECIKKNIEYQKKEKENIVNQNDNYLTNSKGCPPEYRLVKEFNQLINLFNNKENFTSLNENNTDKIILLLDNILIIGKFILILLAIIVIKIIFN